VTNETLSYREAGSFMRFVLDRYGVPRTLDFFRASSRTDTSRPSRRAFQRRSACRLETVESDWLAMLRN
jgi:hypothetical protein